MHLFNYHNNKQHIHCDWLIEKKPGTYCCCDARSHNKGKEFTEQEAWGEACPFFHAQKKKTDLPVGIMAECNF